jgi:hypothetical protein
LSRLCGEFHKLAAASMVKELTDHTQSATDLDVSPFGSAGIQHAVD